MDVVLFTLMFVLLRMGPGSRQTPHPVDLLLYLLESFYVFLFLFRLFISYHNYCIYIYLTVSAFLSTGFSDWTRKLSHAFGGISPVLLNVFQCYSLEPDEDPDGSKRCSGLKINHFLNSNLDSFFTHSI